MLYVSEDRELIICVTRSEQAALQQKLAQIEKKIIVGGENLLEKAEEQEKLLEESAKELEERRQKAESLRKALEEKEVMLSLFCIWTVQTRMGIVRFDILCLHTRLINKRINNDNNNNNNCHRNGS